jgi:hypothetical protein
VLQKGVEGALRAWGAVVAEELEEQEGRKRGKGDGS